MRHLSSTTFSRSQRFFCGSIPNWSRRFLLPILIAAVALISQTACTSMQVHLGMKVYLSKIPVKSIAANLPNGPGVAPGEKTPLVVVVQQPDGKVLQTEGAGHGKILWQDLTVTASVVSVNAKGIVSLPHDPRKSENQIGHVTITVPSHPDLRADLAIPVRYNYAFVSNFSGSAGTDGLNGLDGTDGTSGSMGSIDPNNPSAGGDGGDGTDGSNGQDGSPGGDAPPVQVRLALQSGAHPLLQAEVSAQGHNRFYLIDPNGGSLTVKADGGPGGSGGRGGRGGHGGSGGVGSPSGNSGRDGMDGHDGMDGTAGQGGAITVTYDPQVQPYLQMIHLSNTNGPKPVFKEQAVTALW